MTPTCSIWLSILSFLHSIPNVVWSGVIASVLTVSGVLIASKMALRGVLKTNQDTTERLTIQLRHDAEQRSRERLAALRREVYMASTAATVEAIQHIPQIIALDPRKLSSNKSITNFSVAIAQLSLVSELPSALAASELEGMLSAVLIQTLNESSEMHALGIDIRIKQKMLDRDFEEVRRLQAELRHLNESGEIDPRRAEILQTSSQAKVEQSSQKTQELSELRIKHFQMQTDLYKIVFERLPLLRAQSIKVMAQVRNEIGIDSDLTGFEAQMRRQVESAQSLAMDAMEGWRRQLQN
jgi:hypothetical protein